jgi:hypothetical protein
MRSQKTRLTKRPRKILDCPCYEEAISSPIADAPAESTYHLTKFYMKDPQTGKNLQKAEVLTTYPIPWKEALKISNQNLAKFKEDVKAGRIRRETMPEKRKETDEEKRVRKGAMEKRKKEEAITEGTGRV